MGLLDGGNNEFIYNVCDYHRRLSGSGMVKKQIYKEIRMTEKFTTTKARILRASEQCADAKNILKVLFPKAFEEKEEEKIIDIIDRDFRTEAEGLLSQLNGLVREEHRKTNDTNAIHKAFWIITKFLRCYVPDFIFDKASDVGMNHILDVYEDYKLRNE